MSLPLRLTAGRRTLNAAIVVRIHEGERRCSSAEERRSHTAKGGCSNQPTGTNRESWLIPAVVQWSERLNVNQEAGGSTPSPGTIFSAHDHGGVAQRKSGGLQNRVSAGSIPASPAIERRAPPAAGRSRHFVHRILPITRFSLLKNKAFFRSNLLCLVSD